MSKELCFNIENNALYLEQVLVEYMSVPIFFLCKSQNEYYIVLCIDIEELKYVVCAISQTTVYNLLHGIQPMRDAILLQDYFWEVDSGNTIKEDSVQKKTMEKIDVSVLPEKGACFEILTEDIQTYVNHFDNEFLSNGYTKQECCSVYNEDFSLESEVSLPMFSESIITVETYTSMKKSFTIPKILMEKINNFEDTTEIFLERKTTKFTCETEQENWSVKQDDATLARAS